MSTRIEPYKIGDRVYHPDVVGTSGEPLPGVIAKVEIPDKPLVRFDDGRRYLCYAHELRSGGR